MGHRTTGNTIIRYSLFVIHYSFYLCENSGLEKHPF